MRKDTLVIAVTVLSWIILGAGGYIITRDWPNQMYDPTGLALFAAGGVILSWAVYQFHYGFPHSGEST